MGDRTQANTGGDAGTPGGNPFATLIAAEVRRRHASLRALGGLAGVSHSTLSKVARGARPSPETLRRLAPVLGKSGDELLALAGYRDDTGGMPPPRPPLPEEAIAARLDEIAARLASLDAKLDALLGLASARREGTDG